MEILADGGRVVCVVFERGASGTGLIGEMVEYISVVVELVWELCFSKISDPATSSLASQALFSFLYFLLPSFLSFFSPASLPI